MNADQISGTGSSYNTTLVSLRADGVKTAISGNSDAAAIGATNMSGVSKDSVPALSEGIVAAPTNNTTLVDKNDGVKLCDLVANTSQDIDVYVWMEGCDYDCNSVVVKDITEKAVSVALGFCAGKTA